MDNLLKCEWSEDAVMCALVEAINAWNAGDKSKLQKVRSLLSGFAEQQLISSVRPFLTPPGRKPARGARPPDTLKFVAHNVPGAQPLELRKQLSALRHKIGERGVVADDLALAVAFAMFCESIGLKVAAKPQVSAYKPEDFDRSATRPGQVNKKRDKRSGSIWTIGGGATGMQQTRTKFKY